MANSTNQQCFPTALLEREKETEERARKREKQEEKRLELYEQEKYELNYREINELEELLERDSTKGENQFAIMPKGYFDFSRINQLKTSLDR